MHIIMGRTPLPPMKRYNKCIVQCLFKRRSKMDELIRSLIGNTSLVN